MQIDPIKLTHGINRSKPAAMKPDALKSRAMKPDAMKRIALAALPFLLAACAPEPVGEQAGAATGPNPYGFEINLTLTPRAAERLASTDERVIVAAMYFGAAISADAPGVDEHVMEVGLGSDEIEVGPVNARVQAPGTGFDPANIKSIKGEPEVLVNVYSARKTHENNLISCGLYQGPVTMARKQPVDIACDLIEGLNEDGDVVVDNPTPGE